jgi:integrase
MIPEWVREELYKLQQRVEKLEKDTSLPGLLFHDLRRSAVRNLERAGVPRSQAMAITGHKTESVYRRYAIVSEQDIKAAGEKMQRLMDAARMPDLREGERKQ